MYQKLSMMHASYWCHSERESLLPFMWQGCTTISNLFPICLVTKIEAKQNGKRDVTWRNQISYPESSGSLVSGNSQGVVVKLDKTENAAWFANTYNINDRNVMGNFKSGENMRKKFIQSATRTAQKDKSSSEPPVSLVAADWINIFLIYNRRKVCVIKMQFSTYY